MTIRLEKTNGTTYENSRGVRLVIQSTVAVDTEGDALAAKRAFEQVLAPRFTRDEAIAIVLPKVPRHYVTDADEAAVHAGVRLALEALAAAGAFVVDAAESDNMPCPEHNARISHGTGSCARCDGTSRVPNTMTDKLDAAGIR